MARLRQGKGRTVRRHAQGQGTRNLSYPTALRRSADAAGGRRQVRDQPRAGAADRKPAQAPPQGISQVTGRRYRARRNLSDRDGPSAGSPGRIFRLGVATAEPCGKVKKAVRAWESGPGTLSRRKLLIAPSASSSC